MVLLIAIFGLMHLAIPFTGSVLGKWNLSDEDYEEIQQQVKKFNKCEDNYFVREKWFLWFMLHLGEYMRLNRDFFTPSLGIKEKL